MRKRGGSGAQHATASEQAPHLAAAAALHQQKQEAAAAVQPEPASSGRRRSSASRKAVVQEAAACAGAPVAVEPGVAPAAPGAAASRPPEGSHEAPADALRRLMGGSSELERQVGLMAACSRPCPASSCLMHISCNEGTSRCVHARGSLLKRGCTWRERMLLSPVRCWHVPHLTGWAPTRAPKGSAQKRKRQSAYAAVTAAAAQEEFVGRGVDAQQAAGGPVCAPLHASQQGGALHSSTRF